MITTILSIIISLAAILLILVVYVQNPKGGGLSSDFGSPTTLGGVKQTTEFIDKLTWGLAATIVISAIVMTMQQPKPQKVNNTTPQTQQNPSKQGQPAQQGK
ncbi:MAG: preprotein translocase subunit SecG [Flavobacteriia bacterium]|nr:preprotein translocase subunit SecG [Flavobacteriia bacterium]